jgi:hypothetical protein
MYSVVLKSEKEQNFWFEYFINEKVNYLKKLGLNRMDILEKYRNDYKEYSYNEKDYYNLMVGLYKAIKFIEER